MRRHRRRKVLYDNERNRLVADMVEMLPAICALKPHCDQHRAVLGVSNALVEAIEELSGKRVPRVNSSPGGLPRQK